MTRNAWLTACAAAALALAVGPAPASAAAGDDCVKVLGYEWSGEKQSMDPSDHTSSDDSYRLYNVYDRLVDTDANFNVVPELAESWSVSADGLTWSFKIRQGVKFHDGSDLDAGDVAFSFQRLLDPKLASSAQAVLTFIKAENIKKVDQYTVSFTTEKPTVELPLLLANKYDLIVPEGATHEQLRLHENGTGPYMQDSFTPNAPAVILKANPNYWRKGLPKSPCVRITVAQEALAAQAAIQSGQVDLVLQVDPSVITTLKSDPNVELLSTGASNSMTLSMWVDTPPFDNVKVRQAMKAVIDRQTMVDTALLGFGEVGNDNPLPLSSPASYTHEAPKRDVAKAKQLLAEAGHPDGISVDLYTAEAIPGMVKMAQAYAEMAREAGINVNVIVTPADSYWDNIWLKKPFLTSGWNMRPPGEALSYAYTQKATYKETHWERPDYDQILLKAAQTPDQTERNKTYAEASRILAEEGGVMIPMFVHQVIGVRKGCSGYTPRAQAYNVRLAEFTCAK